MKITRESFHRKPLFVRQGALHLWGIPLAERSDLCPTRHLYSFNNFFVEVCFDRRNGKLTCICSFQCTERLDGYLEEDELTTLA